MKAYAINITAGSTNATIQEMEVEGFEGPNVILNDGTEIKRNGDIVYCESREAAIKRMLSHSETLRRNAQLADRNAKIYEQKVKALASAGLDTKGLKVETVGQRIRRSEIDRSRKAEEVKPKKKAAKKKTAVKVEVKKPLEEKPEEQLDHPQTQQSDMG